MEPVPEAVENKLSFPLSTTTEGKDGCLPLARVHAPAVLCSVLECQVRALPPQARLFMGKGGRPQDSTHCTLKSGKVLHDLST